MAPFPFPAHQTGRADFPHPDFRQSSCQAHGGRGGFVARLTARFIAALGDVARQAGDNEASEAVHHSPDSSLLAHGNIMRWHLNTDSATGLPQRMRVGDILQREFAANQGQLARLNQARQLIENRGVGADEHEGVAQSNRRGIRQPFGSSGERRLRVRQFHVRRRGKRKMIGGSSGERRVVNGEIADQAARPAEDAIQREDRSPRRETQD